MHFVYYIITISSSSPLRPSAFSHIFNHFSVIAEPIKELAAHSAEMEITKSKEKPHELCARIPAFCTCR